MVDCSYTYSTQFRRKPAVHPESTRGNQHETSKIVHAGQVYARRHNFTRPFRGVTVIPVVHFSNTSFCSSKGLFARSSGTSTWYRCTTLDKIPIIIANANRWPIHDLAPTENGTTGAHNRKSMGTLVTKLWSLHSSLGHWYDSVSMKRSGLNSAASSPQYRAGTQGRG